MVILKVSVDSWILNDFQSNYTSFSATANYTSPKIRRRDGGEERERGGGGREREGGKEKSATEEV